MADSLERDISEIISGQSHLEEIRDIEVHDFLGRDPVPPNPSLLSSAAEGVAHGQLPLIAVDGRNLYDPAMVTRQGFANTPSGLASAQTSRFGARQGRVP